MKQEILTRFPWTSLPIAALMIFFVFFLILIVRVSMKSRRHIFEAAERLPLSEGEPCERN